MGTYILCMYNDLHLNISYRGKHIIMFHESFVCNVTDFFKEENDAVK